jgi:hypothetical protein
MIKPHDPTYAIYVVSYNDPERQMRMNARFQKCGLYVHYVDPVHITDSRISCYDDISTAERRNWSIFFQHYDSWAHFHDNTNADYCIVLEDDVYISKDLKNQLPSIIQSFQKYKLDILLLSYLWPYSTIGDNVYFPVLQSPQGWNPFSLRLYPDDLWGAHMYMISRDHAKRMLDKYTSTYAHSCVNTQIPFCTDWQFTKWGNRALLEPMVGVEEGEVKTDHVGQMEFHKKCSEMHFSHDKFF